MRALQVSRNFRLVTPCHGSAQATSLRLRGEARCGIRPSAMADARLTAAERARRHRAKLRAQRDPKHYLVQALELFDRLDQAPHRVASELLHKIELEAAKRRRHARASDS